MRLDEASRLPGSDTTAPTTPGWWRGPAVAVCAVGWGANQFAALLPFYRLHLGASLAVVQATFGLYAVGLVPGLLLGGPLSDRHGRRVVVRTALPISFVASVVLMLGAHGAGWLFAGRLVAGLASGAAFSAGAAWLKELSSAPFDPAPPGTGARRATVAMTTGFGAGPLAAGLIAQWGPVPAVSAYVPHLLLLVVAAVVTRRTPETRTRPVQTDVPGVTAAHRHPRFVRVVLPLAPWVFVAGTVPSAFLPTVVASSLHGFGTVFGSVAVVVTCLAGVLVQPAAQRIGRSGERRLLGSAMLAIAIGLAVAALAATLVQPALVLVAALVLGAGYGGAMVFGLAEVARIAAPHELARLTALFQAGTYVGFAAPYLLAALQVLAPVGGAACRHGGTDRGHAGLDDAQHAGVGQPSTSSVSMSVQSSGRCRFHR
ncbi:MAG TPA: MFS transporter [Streptosporangiales bacterium]